MSVLYCKRGMFFENMNKKFTGDKYIFYLMALKLCIANRNTAIIGKDNGMVGGQKFYRKFRFFPKTSHNNTDILLETKSSKGFADFTRSIEVLYANDELPAFRPYINEYGENCYVFNH